MSRPARPPRVLRTSLVPTFLAPTFLAPALLAACAGPAPDPSPPARPAPPPVAALPPGPAPVAGPVLDAGGACTGPAPAGPDAIAPGIGECDLVRLKGRPPTDVLVGEGRQGREVQVLYAEPGGRELYFFVQGRLDRVVR